MKAHSYIRTSMRLAAILLALAVLYSCDKDREHPVPYVHVNFDFNIIHYNLNSVGSSHQFSQAESGGYRGIMVYRVSMDQFRAFDRACPCDPHHCMVSILPDNPVLAHDPCCESTFLLIDGSVVEGEAQFPLKEYQAHFSTTSNRLRITN